MSQSPENLFLNYTHPFKRKIEIQSNEFLNIYLKYLKKYKKNV